MVFSELTPTGVWLAIHMGMLTLAAHFSHEVEHLDEDIQAGIRTHAMLFGPRSAFRLGLLLFLADSLLFIYVSVRHMESVLCSLLGAAVLLVWCVQLLRLWTCPKLHAVKRFRGSYRVLYACACSALVAFRWLERLG